MIQNLQSIWYDMDQIEIHSQIIQKYLQVIKEDSSQFNQDTVIIEPSELITASPFVERFYPIPEHNFLAFDDNWQQKLGNITSNKNNVFVFDFKQTNTVQIINLTDQFRKTGKI